MSKVNPSGIARFIGFAMILLPIGYLINDTSGICYASIVSGLLLILANLDELTDKSLN